MPTVVLQAWKAIILDFFIKSNPFKKIKRAVSQNTTPKSLTIKLYLVFRIWQVAKNPKYNIITLLKGGVYMKEKLLLIAEKPSLMRELREVYTNHKNEINYDIDFMALAGHVCMYGKPNDYEQWNKKWVELDLYLPMVPEKWKINVMPDKKSLYSSIKEQIEKRNIAKKEKNFALADSIRDELKEKGIIIKDTREGTIYEIM